MIRTYDYVIFTSEEDYKQNTVIDRFGDIYLQNKSAYKRNKIFRIPEHYPAYYWRYGACYELFYKKDLSPDRIESIKKEMLSYFEDTIQEFKESIVKAKKQIQALKGLG